MKAALTTAGEGSPGVARTSATVATVTLPAVATYDIVGTETVTVIAPASGLTGAISLTASPTFTVEGDAPPPTTTTSTTTPGGGGGGGGETTTTTTPTPTSSTTTSSSTTSTVPAGEPAPTTTTTTTAPSSGPARGGRPADVVGNRLVRRH